MRKKTTEEVKLDATLPPVLEEQIPVSQNVDIDEQAKAIVEGFSEPQPTAPVEIVVELIPEPVKRETIEVDKIMLYKTLYSLGHRNVYHYSGISLVNKLGEIFCISQEDGNKKWEEIKEFVGKL